MLAEPRKKQRLSLDPQNVAWERDKGKFGLKMLQKMGWSEGKGLGAREDGVSSHIKVSIKRDNAGIGAARNASDNWLENTTAFDSLLASLNQSVEPTGAQQVAAKEKPSKPAAAKVQTKRNGLYGKFLRGKDLSRYKEKDMAEIFATARKGVVTAAAADGASPLLKRRGAEDDAVEPAEGEDEDEDGAGRAFVGFSQRGKAGSDDDDVLPTRTASQDMYSYFQRKSGAAADTVAEMAEGSAEERRRAKKLRKQQRKAAREAAE